MANLEEIANGGPFDLADAIRSIANHLVNGSMRSTSEQLPAPVASNLAQKFNQRLASVLVKAGFDSEEKIIAATDEQLLAVDGIGEKVLADIREKLGAA